MELRHLRYFLAVAEKRHFGRAAEGLHMAQPPLSQQIRQLEAEVGAPLLERTTRKVELTPAGVVFMERARHILAAADAAAADALRAARGELGRLSIGFTGSSTYDLMPTVAKLVRQELPGVALDLHGEMLTSAQVSRLLDHSLDLGFLRPPVRTTDLNVRVIRSEPLVVALPAGHPLARRRVVPLADLAADSFIVYPTHFRSVTHEAVEEACQKAGFHPRVALEVSETATMVSFVAAGLGVALVPAAARHLRITGAVYRTLEEKTEVTLALAWRAGDRSPVLTRFLRDVKPQLMLPEELDERGFPGCS